MGEGQPQTRNRKQRMERELGDYRILAELARGGMGRVYVARRSGQAGFERYFAIKVMHQNLNDDEKWVMMLLDEAHIASRLHHPNVVPVLDIGTFSEGYYLVMDYVEGCSLQQLLKKSPEHRPIKAIVSVMLDALRGLHAVHTLRGMNDEELHVVHRDVSPHNLLLGVDGTCRVTDFGIAKAKQRFTDTDVGTHKGKLAFMAPEQMRGQAGLDARVDVWASGVTLYEAIAGVHPFRGDNDAATIHSVIGGEVKLPSEVGLKPPAAFDAVIMRALQRDPEARYATADDFAEALREVASKEHMLGSASDVAQWVKATCGAELTERRRKLAAIPKSTDTGVTSGTATLPKLWRAQDGNTNAGESSASQTMQNESLPVDKGVRAASTGFAGLEAGRKRTVIAASLVGVALLILVGVLLGRGVQSERVEHEPVQAPPSLPAATDKPVEPPVSADAPLAPSPAPAIKVVEPVEEPAPRESLRKPPPSKARKPEVHGAAPVKPRPEATPAPEAAPPSAPAREPAPPPARSTPRLDDNPYLLGE
ncbi:MAG: serine/threonine-protein kinase [Polyangiales bacterium]